MKKKRLLRIWPLACLALLFSLNSWAQQTIRGTLRNASGEPVIAASVALKGGDKTVVTDAAGRFTIDAPVGSTLVVTSVGYEAREIVVTGSEINEVLQTAASSLTDVVVIG
ncbi:MAG: carboxypeptidase-like regulatory domain-containing protein, partial [Chitinophagaceae bacterium]